jgi:pimeloyl-ACP methyl ester carboxylesterase
MGGRLTLQAGAQKKPLALLIPGLDGTGELFRAQLGTLAGTHRPCPWSYGPGTGFQLDDLTRQIGEATAAELPSSILVIAESFGGLVALSYVLRYPERVRQVILVNTFPFYRRRWRVRLARFLAPLLVFSTARRVKDFVVDRTLEREGVPVEARRHYHKTIRSVPLEAYRWRLQLIRQADLRPRLHEIHLPTLLLASGRDKLVPSIREAHFMASQLSNARVHEFPNAGHALLMTPGFSLADYVQKIHESEAPL